MSAHLLQQLVDTDALKPPVAFHLLAEAHVPFDELNSTDQFESALAREARQEGGSTVVLGSSGSGKSSMIAAVAGGVSPERWIVRIRGDHPAELLERGGFVRYVAEMVVRALDHDGHAPSVRSRGPEKLLAESDTVVSGGHQFGPRAAQIKSAAHEVERRHGTSGAFGALDELCDLTADAGRRMLLVVEDTDVFMPPRDIPGGHSHRTAERFISNVLPFLAREAHCPSLVAVNDRYRSLVEKHLGGTVRLVDVPRVDEPAGALVRIMERQALRNGFHLTAPIIEDEALTFLAGALASGVPLRTALRAIYDGALKTVRESPGAARISVAAVMAQF